MSAFNLYFLHVEFVGCFGQEQSYGTEHMLFYHCNIKYLAFQYNNSVLAVGGSILVAAFWWRGYCGVLVSWTELLPVDRYCFDILGVAFLFLTWP